MEHSQEESQEKSWEDFRDKMSIEGPPYIIDRSVGNFVYHPVAALLSTGFKARVDTSFTKPTFKFSASF